MEVAPARSPTPVSRHRHGDFLDFLKLGAKSYPRRQLHVVIAGGDCIDDADVLRCGATSQVLGHRVMAPSTIGTFLRAFTFGHVRQLDRLREQILTRAWAAGAGPGDGPALVAARADSGEVLHARQRTGRANTARGTARFVDELPPGSAARGRLAS